MSATMVKRCPHVLTEGPRSGQVCGRIYRAGCGCERHRPKRPARYRKVTPEENARAKERSRIRSITAGVPAGWDL